MRNSRGMGLLFNSSTVVSLQCMHTKYYESDFLNQFHKEATERKKKKIAASKKSQMSSKDFANYMKRNLAMAKQM